MMAGVGAPCQLEPAGARRRRRCPCLPDASNIILPAGEGKLFLFLHQLFFLLQTQTVYTNITNPSQGNTGQIRTVVKVWGVFLSYLQVAKQRHVQIRLIAGRLAGGPPNRGGERNAGFCTAACKSITHFDF